MKIKVIIAIVLFCVASLVIAASDKEVELQNLIIAQVLDDVASDAELFAKGQEVADRDEVAIVMCEEAYKLVNDKKDIGDFDIVESFNKNGGSQAGAKLAINNVAKSLMIGFSGTHSLSDAISDVNGLKSQVMPGLGKVHYGFYFEYAKVKDAVFRKVAEYVKKGYNREILVTGHSLGGAEAVIAAAELKQAYPRLNIRCVTAGCPALGDQDFVNNYAKLNIETTRYVNGGDIVARVAGGIAWWRHVGNMVNLQSTLATLLASPIIGNTRKHFLSSYKRNGKVGLEAGSDMDDVSDEGADDDDDVTESEINEFLADMKAVGFEL